MTTQMIQAQIGGAEVSDTLYMLFVAPWKCQISREQIEQMEAEECEPLVD
jgi:hypothetical protein